MATRNEYKEYTIIYNGHSYGIMWYRDRVTGWGFTTNDEARRRAERIIARNPQIYKKGKNEN